MGQALHPDLGVPHGGRRIPVDGSEVALAVDERVAHREILSHAHDSVVDGGVAVRMVFTDHVADDTGRLLIGLVEVVLELAHGVKHAAVNGFEPVAHIRQRPADDDAHGVIEIGLFHLLLDADFGCPVHLNHGCSWYTACCRSCGGRSAETRAAGSDRGKTNGVKRIKHATAPGFPLKPRRPWRQQSDAVEKSGSYRLTNAPAVSSRMTS